MSIKSLINLVKEETPQINTDKLMAAYRFAKKAHAGQKRASGVDYIEHPMEVTKILTGLHLDEHTLIASLLHDVVEDANFDIKQIEDLFGKHVAELVEGVTKLDAIEFAGNSKQEYFVENVRKMLLAMAQDIRVVLIKLADRLHNMRTLKYVEPDHARRIAEETLEIYAPLANRLGMGEIKGELEDLAFPYVYPEEYKRVKALIEDKVKVTKDYINSIKESLIKELREVGVNVLDIHGRIKHMYSLYKKLLRYDNNIENIHDLVAMRLIVQKEENCYVALGLIHGKWKPMVGRVKDYIGTPKANGYKSLHTTVLGDEGMILEIQIRTKEMHEEAEYGVAAHWHYAETKAKGDHKEGVKIPKSQVQWIKQLIRWQEDMSDSGKFYESLKIDVFKDRLFVFTPNGDVIDLPDGATPVDFAYHIHTEIGNACIGAKINNKIAPLETPLQNGDLVEVITSKTRGGPSQDWLEFVKTNEARDNIKDYFKKINREKSLEYGSKMINRELQILKKPAIEKQKSERINKALKDLQYKDLDKLLIAIGQGDVSIKQVLNKILTPRELLQPTTSKKYFFFGETVQRPRAIVGEEEGIVTTVAKCCNPVPGDKIRALISKSRGAVLHRYRCANIKKGKRRGSSIMNAYWEGGTMTYLRASVHIDTLDRVGLLRDISSTVSAMGINIISISFRSRKNDLITFVMNLEVKNVDQLINVMNRLRKLKSIIEVTRQ
ncbi:MAG: bifunctional (p)ppGpp synthetase/guanosine-3',5'-bis(diphosphate) 3'-pyrophosphohydrolase [bacterium]